MSCSVPTVALRVSTDRYGFGPTLVVQTLRDEPTQETVRVVHVETQTKSASITLHPHTSEGWSGQADLATHLVLNSGFSNLRLEYCPSVSPTACIAFDTGIDSDFLRCRESHAKIAVLWEPASINGYGHASVRKWVYDIDLLLTHDERLIEEFPGKAKFLPVGGSYLWRKELLSSRRKSKLVSISASKKNNLPGHKLRHEVIARFRSSGLKPFGTAYRKYKSPGVPYRNFLFSVVIENCREEGNFFTEKLIHPLLFRTVPIYWGARELPRAFDEAGIIRFETPDDLAEILARIGRGLYEEILPFVLSNQRAALEFSSSELNIQRIVAEHFGVEHLSAVAARSFFADPDSLLHGKSRFTPAERTPF